MRYMCNKYVTAFVALVLTDFCFGKLKDAKLNDLSSKLLLQTASFLRSTSGGEIQLAVCSFPPTDQQYFVSNARN